MRICRDIYAWECTLVQDQTIANTFPPINEGWELQSSCKKHVVIPGDYWEARKLLYICNSHVHYDIYACWSSNQHERVPGRYLNTLLKPKRHLLRCHDVMAHALLLRMCTNVVYFRVMRRLCRREWNWLWNWRCVNQHSWDPWQRTTWSRRVTSDLTAYTNR